MDIQKLTPTQTQLIYSVSEISSILKTLVENNFSHIKIRGELSSVKQHVSGHVYFTLKDTDSLIDGVCWRGIASQFYKLLQDGLEVICTGRLTTYPNRSKYQIIVESVELAGQGALLKLLEERKKKLAAEGLFDLDRKKPLPTLPQSIGIITSPTGAVIRDMIHRIEERFPRLILLWPVLVQGQGAAEQVAAAIKGFNTLPIYGAIPRPDLLIVARGGGSLEDLWAFNEEIVVRAVSESEIPLIAAIGHETDVTLIDFAADFRAPTPTAAAERAVPVRNELIKMNNELALRLKRNIKRFYEDRLLKVDEWQERFLKALLAYMRDKLNQLRALQLRSPLDLLHRLQDKFAHYTGRLMPEILHTLKDKQQSLDRLSGLLESYSYTKVLARGFCLIKAQNHIIHRGKDLSPSQIVELKFYDIHVPALIIEPSDSSPEQPR